MRRVGIMLSTNDPDNGNDTGKVTAVTALNRNDSAIDLVFDGYPSHAPVCRITTEPQPGLHSLHRMGTLQLSHRVFPIFYHKDWYGNWCWRLVTVDIKTANEIFRYLYSMGKWNCEGGYTRFYDLWRR